MASLISSVRSLCVPDLNVNASNNTCCSNNRNVRVVYNEQQNCFTPSTNQTTIAFCICGGSALQADEDRMAWEVFDRTLQQKYNVSLQQAAQRAQIDLPVEKKKLSVSLFERMVESAEAISRDRPQPKTPPSPSAPLRSHSSFDTAPHTPPSPSSPLRGRSSFDTAPPSRTHSSSLAPIAESPRPRSPVSLSQQSLGGQEGLESPHRSPHAYRPSRSPRLTARKGGCRELIQFIHSSPHAAKMAPEKLEQLEELLLDRWHAKALVDCTEEQIHALVDVYLQQTPK